MIIGIAGRAGSGKDTFASFLPGYTVKHFARPLKDAVQAAFGLDPDQTSTELKDVVDPRYGLTPRQMLQRTGTDLFRAHFGQDFWVRRLMHEIDAAPPGQNVAVADVRFQNEAQAIQKRGGIVVYIDRPDLPPLPPRWRFWKQPHVSERFDPKWANITIPNDGDLERLRLYAETTIAHASFLESGWRWKDHHYEPYRRAARGVFEIFRYNAARALVRVNKAGCERDS